jgi:hypothetical protein
MKTFTCLLMDGRYSVATLSSLVTATNDRALARRELEANAHQLGCELHEGGLVCAEAR